MQFHLHTKTLLSAILLSLHYCSGHIFECHRHIDEIPACISKLFFQGFQCIEKTTMVQKQFFVGHPLKSQQIPIFSHCSVHWRICHSSNFWTIPVWDHQNNRCFIAVPTKYCDQLSQRQLTSLTGGRAYHHRLHQECLNTLLWQPFHWNDDDGKLIGGWGEDLNYLNSSWLRWEQAFLRAWTKQAD